MLLEYFKASQYYGLHLLSVTMTLEVEIKVQQTA